MKYKIKNTTAAEKTAFINDMIKLWEERATFFPSVTPKGTYMAKACQLQYDNRKELGLTKDELFAAFNQAYKADVKTFTNPKSLYTYFSLMVDLYDENVKTAQQLFSKYDDISEKIEFEVKNYNIEDIIVRKEARRMDKFAQYAVVASDEAIKDAGITADNVDKHRVGVIWGAGIGGLETFQIEMLEFAKGDGTPRFNPFFIPKMISDIACGHISIKYGFRGPNFATVSACASSTNAIIDAFNYIRLGHADAMITGGSEAAVSIAGMGGFNAMHALSTRNDDPKTASRPMDKDRDGFVLGEGAGALILEEYTFLKRPLFVYDDFISVGNSKEEQARQLSFFK